MADSPVQIEARHEEVEGQPQARSQEPHDGRHFLSETTVVTDRVILDPNDELAVQVPEGVGASTYGHRSPLGEALSVGTAEEQFARARDEENKSAAPARKSNGEQAS